MGEGLISPHGVTRIRDVDWSDQQSRMAIAGLVRQILGSFSGEPKSSAIDGTVRLVVSALPRARRQVLWPAVWSLVNSIASEAADG